MNESVRTQNNLSVTNVDNGGTINYNRNNKSYLNESGSDVQNNVYIDRTIYQFKIILIGDTCVGKTTLVNRFMGYEFDDKYKCTISADFKVKLLAIDPKIGAELTIWDTCGHEKFRSLTRQYFKDAHGIVLVYDVCDRKSFFNLNSWVKEINNNKTQDASIVLVGNKIDLPERVVSKKEAEEYAQKNGFLYVETSSKEGMYIDLPFENLAHDIVDRVKKQQIEGVNNSIEQDGMYRLGGKKEIEKIREKDVNCC